MNIIHITLEEAEEFFSKHPQLIEMGFCDESYNTFKKDGTVEIADEYFLGLEVNGILEGVWTFSCFTPTTLICHGYINPELHHKGISFELQDCVNKHIKEHANTIKNIMMIVPAPCIQIIKMAQLHNFREVGMIPKGIVWRNKLTTLYIYTKEVQ